MAAPPPHPHPHTQPPGRVSSPANIRTRCTSGSPSLIVRGVAFNARRSRLSPPRNRSCMCECRGVGERAKWFSGPLELDQRFASHVNIIYVAAHLRAAVGRGGGEPKHLCRWSAVRTNDELLLLSQPSGWDRGCSLQQARAQPCGRWGKLCAFCAMVLGHYTTGEVATSAHDVIPPIRKFASVKEAWLQQPKHQEHTP